MLCRQVSETLKQEGRKVEEERKQEVNLPKQKELKIGKQWDFVASMQSKRWGHSATTHGNLIYSIGGNDGEKELASVERYNINSNSWESVTSLQSNRYNHASVCCGDSIFCIGGLSNESLTNIVEKYDIKSNQWSSVTPIITSREKLGAATYREFIFATGGYNGGSLATVEKYNTLTNQWSSVSRCNDDLLCLYCHE